MTWLWSRSRRTNVSSRSCLEKNCQRLGLVSVSWGRRLSPLGLGHLRLMSKTNFRPNCAGHSTQYERASDVVSLCCIVTIAHHINTLKQWTWKVTSRPVIAINKTCTLTSRSRLESLKRLVWVSSRNFNVSSRSRAFTSHAHPCGDDDDDDDDDNDNMRLWFDWKCGTGKCRNGKCRTGKYGTNVTA